MASTHLWLAAVAVAGLTGLVARQDPGIDFQFAAPNFSEIQEPEAIPASDANVAVLGQAAAPVQGGKLVTFSLKQAPARKALDILQEKGFSFVIADDEAAASKSITMNVVDVPLEQAANAVAEAMGGTWVKRNGVHVFRKGGIFGMEGVPRYRTQMMPGQPLLAPLGALPDTNKAIEEAIERATAEVRRLNSSSEREQALKALEEARRTLRAMPRLRGLREVSPSRVRVAPGRPLGPESLGIQKSLEMALKELRQNKEMDPKQRAEAEREIEKVLRERPWEEAFKEMEKAFGQEFGPKFDREFAKSFGPEFEREFSKNLDVRVFDKDAMLKLRPGQQSAIELRSLDGKAFVKSLTKEQRDLHKKRGYLKVGELSPSQRQKLGIKSVANKVTIELVVDGEKIRIEND